ncbi:MAG: SusC/RagA family TonB-linked outer membrane protein [Candidatus Cyclobacteriaceae bacterium M3_2C_046]
MKTKLKVPILKIFLLTGVFLVTQMIAFAQDRSIKGKVISYEDNQSVPGANVVVKGTTIGTVTDIDGNFTLTIPEDAQTLVVSYVGYTSEEVSIGNKTNFSINLMPDITQLQELVVVGYGQQERREITAAITSVKSSEIEDVPLPSFDQMIQGRAAGVHVVSSNVPGGGTQIRIRGNSSINAGNEPLYVVDGVPILSDNTDNQLDGGQRGGNPLSYLNPNDIASIEILKDAAASSIYGARAANGVVLITTKRGTSGSTTINARVYTGFQSFTRQLPMITGPQAKTLIVESISNNPAENPPSFLFDPSHQDYQFYNNDTDWVDAVVNENGGRITDYNVSLRGGSDNLRFAGSIGYFDQKGVIIDNTFQRISTGTNLDYDISPKVRVGTSLRLAREINDRDNGVYGAAVRTLPYNALWKQDSVGNDVVGVWPDQTHQSTHPLKQAARLNNLYTNRIINNTYLEWDIVPGLNLRTSFGVDSRDESEERFNPGFNDNNPARTAQAQKIEHLTWINENILSYNKTFNEVHSLSALAGMSMQETKVDRLRAEGRGASADIITTLNASAVPNPFNVSGANFPGIYSYISNWGIMSFFGRVNYNYNDKYLASFNIRRDGSSRFGPKNKWAVFPSGSVGWRVSSEPFFEGMTSVVDDFKIRGSFGQTGNQSIGDEAAYATYGTGYGYLGVPGVAPESVAVPTLSWESTTQTNIGIDLTIINNRVTFVADWYRKVTDDLLMALQLPESSGFSNSLQNFGQILNTGYEFQLIANILDRDFKWNVNANIAFNENSVKSLPGGKDLIQSTGGLKPFFGVAKEGELLGNFYGWTADGVYAYDEDAYLVQVGERDGDPIYDFANSPEEATLDGNGNPMVLRNAGGYAFQGGDMIFRDWDQNGVINNDDRTVIGRSQPKFFGGFNNTFAWKGIELNMFWQYQYGNDIMSYFRTQAEGMWNWANATTIVLNRWRKQGDVTEVPKAVFRDDDANNARVSSRFLEDGSYMRLKNVTLSYQLPNTLLDNTFIKTARVYMSGNNLLTFTRYLGNDPEQFSGGIIGGIDWSIYPVSRTITFGVDVNF